MKTTRATHFARSTLTPLAIILAVAIGTPEARAAAAQATHNETNEANNPLTPKITASFQNYYQNLYDVDGDANSFLLRGITPMKLGGAVQLLRATLPIVTVPTPGGGHVTNVGDLNIVDFFPYKAGPVEVGIGPQLTIPTAFKDETGTGKWQAGLGGLLLSNQPWGIAAAIATWQTSFAGDSGRPTQNNATLQPLIIYNLVKGYYLRSSAILNFQLNNDHAYSIPVGLGLGKVIKLQSGTTVNIFIEPQWTIAHDGTGVPQFQLFLGLNLQFPLHIKPH